MQGDTAVAVGGAWKERVSEFLCEHLLRIAPALRRSQDLHGYGWEALSAEQALMGGRIIELDEGLMALFQVARGACQR
jgi:hypothetical protein